MRVWLRLEQLLQRSPGVDKGKKETSSTRRTAAPCRSPKAKAGVHGADVDAGHAERHREAGYTLTLANQTKYHFRRGRLESITDRNGNETTLAYSEGRWKRSPIRPGAKSP